MVYLYLKYWYKWNNSALIDGYNSALYNQIINQKNHPVLVALDDFKGDYEMQKIAIELLEIYKTFAIEEDNDNVEKTIDIICKTFGSFDNCIRIAKSTIR